MGGRDVWVRFDSWDADVLIVQVCSFGPQLQNASSC